MQTKAKNQTANSLIWEDASLKFKVVPTGSLDASNRSNIRSYRIWKCQSSLAL